MMSFWQNCILVLFLCRASALFVGVYEPTKQKLLKTFPDHLSAVAHLVRGFFLARSLNLFLVFWEWRTIILSIVSNSTDCRGHRWTCCLSYSSTYRGINSLSNPRVLLFKWHFQCVCCFRLWSRECRLVSLLQLPTLFELLHHKRALRVSMQLVTLTPFA